MTELVPTDGENSYFDDSLERAEGGMRLKAFIANFRNDRIAGTTVSDWDFVRAQIVYRDQFEVELESVAAACWVGTSDEHVHFEKALIRSVIVAMRTGGGKWVSVFTRENRDVDSYGAVVRDLKTVDLSNDIRFYGHL